MADLQTHYIRLVGIKSKEALMIESFLSMASDGDFLIKIDQIDSHPPEAVLVDELFHSDSLEEDFPDSKIFIIGDDTSYDAPDYLHRPLKWSSFEERIIASVISVVDSKKSQSPSIDNSSAATQVIEAETDEGFSGISEFDVTVTDDKSSTMQEPVAAAPLAEIEQALSEFSISQISVKEASQGDQTSDYSETVSHSYSEIGTVIEESVELVEMQHSRVKAERKVFEGNGLVLGPNIVFWENFDCLMTVRSRPVLYILSSMGSVYSEYNYLDWGLLLKSKYARVYPLPKDWTAQEKLTKYPLSWLVWFSSIARSRGYLLKSINKDDFFMIDEWPSFDQVYNDNNHLRLSSLLSTGVYSIQGLVSKTRLSTKVIVSYLNACEKQGLLKSFTSREEALKLQKSVLPPKAG